MIDVMQSHAEVKSVIEYARRDFDCKNAKALKKDTQLIPDSDIDAIERIQTISPIHIGVIEAADNWIVETLRDAARSPSENEWNRLKAGPLDGAIGMSFALQWRYNFGRLFGIKACDVDAS